MQMHVDLMDVMRFGKYRTAQFIGPDLQNWFAFIPIAKRAMASKNVSQSMQIYVDV